VRSVVVAEEVGISDRVPLDRMVPSVWYLFSEHQMNILYFCYSYNALSVFGNNGVSCFTFTIHF